jgi:hypothetical protein
MSAPFADDALAAYQAALSALLHLDLPAADKAHRLATDPAFEPYRAYVATFDSRLIETLTAVSRSHARKRGSGPRT